MIYKRKIKDYKCYIDYNVIVVSIVRMTMRKIVQTIMSTTTVVLYR